MQNTVFIMTKTLHLATWVKNVIICDGFGEQDKCLENKSILCHIILTGIMPIKVIWRANSEFIFCEDKYHINMGCFAHEKTKQKTILKSRVL